MYGYPATQPIVIKQSAPRKRYSKKSSKLFKKYKRGYWAARKLRDYWTALNPRGQAASRIRYGLNWAAATPEQRLYRRGLGFRGEGDYLTDIGKWGSRAVGMGIGGFLGGIPGAALGHKYGAKFSKYMGWGDYGGDAGGNQIMAGSADTPMTVNASDDLSGDIYFSHREFLGNVTALGTGTTTPSAFNLVSYPINVGLVSTFPWLSQVAENFTLYQLVGCVFEYRPTSGELGSVSNALGKIVMATQYDPDAPDFTSTVEMENYDYNDACKPSEHMLHGIETARSQAATNMLYVRTGPSPKDKIFTDYGTFQIATEGLPVNAAAGTIINVGELWVSYRVKLSRAKLFGSLLGGDVGFDAFWSVADAANLNNKTAASIASNNFTQYTPNPPASTASARLTNNIGCVVRTNPALPRTSLIVTFPKNIVSGTYRLCFQVTNASAFTMVFNIPTVTFGALAVCNGLDGAPGTATYAAGGVFIANGFSVQEFIVNISAPGTNQATVTMSWTNNLPDNSIVATYVQQLPSSINA